MDYPSTEEFEKMYARMQYSERLLLKNPHQPIAIFKFLNARQQKSIRYVYEQNDGDLRVVAPFGMFLTLHKNITMLRKFCCYKETFEFIWKDNESKLIK